MSLLLPKGIVRNSESIEGAVGQIDVEPLDIGDIAGLWKVYTTTRRRLQDPTAERLEHFWWRIWGSQRRELRGATVARLFAHISDGPTFVPLRGPPNRDEGTPLLERSTRFRPGAASATTLHRSTQSRPSTSKAPAVMPHPILKKTRGPSSTGPRPTARFISPHESERDSDPESPVGTNSHVVVQPPSPDVEAMKLGKKSAGSTGGKKKSGFVASTAATKKRPTVVRRQSSQSSAEYPHPAGSSAKTTPSAVVEQSQPQKKSTMPSKFQENFSPAVRSSPSTGTGIVRAKSKTSETVANSKQKSPIQSNQHQRNPEAGPSNRSDAAERSREEVEDVDSDELELQKALLQQSNTSRNSAPKGSQEGSLSGPSERIRIQPKARSTSDEGAGGVRMLPSDTKSTTSLAPTLTTAAGRVNVKSGTSAPASGRASPSARDRGKGKGKETDDLFTKRPVPPTNTAASDEPTGSLARSKSQLTLLLEKDRAKGSDGTSPRKKKH